MMNHAVHPVEIRIVDYEHNRDRKQVVGQSKVSNFRVKIRIGPQNDHNQKEDACKNKGRLHRIKDFQYHLFVLRENKLDLMPEELVSEKDVAQQIRSACY